ncbi:MAG: hypothetical protein Q8R17_01280 [bacterium]|nr:hypothetical protein [bacterium]
MTGNKKIKNGFTLLFASLVGSLLLAIGIATFNIVLRELDLSSVARESHVAFYAADSGWECAFYHDRKRPAVFATSTNSLSIPNPTTIRCRNGNIGVSSTRESLSAVSTFRIPLDGTACADVTVSKIDDNQDKISATIIESRGKNDCTANPNPNRVERAIRVKY